MDPYGAHGWPRSDSGLPTDSNLFLLEGRKGCMSGFQGEQRHRCWVADAIGKNWSLHSRAINRSEREKTCENEKRNATMDWIKKRKRLGVPFSSFLLMVSFTSFQASIHYISTHSDLSRVNVGTSFSLSRPYPNSIARFAMKYIYAVNWLAGKTESRGLFEPSRQWSWSQCGLPCPFGGRYAGAVQ